MSVPNTA